MRANGAPKPHPESDLSIFRLELPAANVIQSVAARFRRPPVFLLVNTSALIVNAG
jgi:hypothetical protein